ncbi:MAG: hypothetical protein LH467_02345 [Gemmatimonadaceae bacterium]|nr:hypothetical protein [Gemmatimonadaceae bacterium]
MIIEPDGSILTAFAGQVLRIARDGARRVIAGNGTTSYSGDGGPATETGVLADRIARAPDGSLYIADATNMRLRRVDAQGIITTVAGNGTCGDSGDGLPATQAQFCAFNDIAFGPDGSLYVSAGTSQYYPSRVRRIGPDGIVTHFAGVPGWSCDFSGCGDYFEGSTAATAPLGQVGGLAFLPDGSLLIADSGLPFATVIWKVSPSGVRTRFAGNIGYSDRGDGGQARDANFAGIMKIATGPAGTVYVLTDREVVRQIGSDGIITTVAGSGSGSSCGDAYSPPCPPSGSNALQVPLPVVYSLAVSAENSLYIAEAAQQNVLRLTKPLPDADARSGGFTRDETGYDIASEDGALIHRFNLAGRHLVSRDATTGTTLQRFAYDAAGKLVSVTDASGNVTTIARDADGMPQAIIGPYGQRTLLSLDSSGNLATVRAPGGETVRFAYDALGRMTTRTDPGGALHQFRYNAVGLLESDSNPDGFVQTLATAPTATGRRVTVTSGATRTRRYVTESLPTGGYRRVTTDEAGLATTTTVDAADSVTTARPDGTLVTTARGADPRFGMQAPLEVTTVRMPRGLANTTRSARTVTLATASDPLHVRTQVDSMIENGVAMTTTFDALARTQSTRSAESRVSVTTLDSLGRAIESVSGGLAAATFQYDARGRVQQVVDAGRVSRFDYDALGQLEGLTDPTGARTQFTRDSLGRILTVRDTAATVGFSYDSAGRLQTLTPAGRPAHSFRYTPGGLLREYEAPSVPGLSSTITRYRYDADQQLRTVTRPSGDSLVFAYDSAGRPTTVTSSDATTTFGFNPSTGLLTSVASTDGGTYSLGYDGALLTSAALTGGAVTGNVSYGYDSFFRPNAVAVNDDTIALEYDRDGLLRQTGQLAIARSAATGLVDSTRLDAVRTAYRYDASGVIAGATTRANGAVVYDYGLQRDALDRIIRRTETVGGVTTDTRFAYDSAGRLFTVTRDGVLSAAYTYDANGNRLTRTSAAGVESGVVDAQDRLVSYGGAEYRYTDAGELTQRVVGSDTTAYHYDAAGALRWVRQPNGTRIDYVIDPTGRRIGKRVNGALTERFLYESELRIAAELAPSGEVRSRFVYGMSENVPEYMIRNGQQFRMVTDHLGSVRLVLNAVTGEVVQTLEYDDSGRVLQNSSSGFQPFGYAGGLYDDTSRLVRFGRRDYDAVTGRWTSKDPIQFAGRSPNLYAYAANNPITRADPTGLWSVQLGFFWGFGATVTLGNSNGDWFGRVQAGVGAGGGINFDPFGTFPIETGGQSPAAFLGVSIGASGNLGPISGGAEALKGLLITKNCEGTLKLDSVSQPFNPGLSFKGQEGWGVGLSFSLNFVDIAIQR